MLLIEKEREILLGCASKKTYKIKKENLTKYISGNSWDRIAIDCAILYRSRLQRKQISYDIHGFCMKWPEVVSNPNEEVRTVARALLNNVTARHGVPQELVSDQRRMLELRFGKN